MSSSHLVVLSGLVSACVNRTHYAAELLHDGLEVGSVSVLGAHRSLSRAERVQASELGFGVLRDEADVIVEAARRAFCLAGGSAGGKEGSAAPGANEISPEELPSAGVIERLHAARAHHRWPDREPPVDVVIAPSSDPARRRASTADQLRYWAGLVGVDSSHDIIFVTTQLYAPFQYMDALRVLGLERGCGVYPCGVDAANALVPVKAFGAREYLQEIRAGLRAAAALLHAARGRGPGAATGSTPAR